jgi:hypothetical protein
VEVEAEVESGKRVWKWNRGVVGWTCVAERVFSVLRGVMVLRVVLVSDQMQLAAGRRKGKRRRSIALQRERTEGRQRHGAGGEQTVVAETRHCREIVSHRGAACHVGRIW